MRYLLFFLLLSSPVFAHETENYSHVPAQIIPAALEKNIVKMTKDTVHRYIQSNGIPNHQTGSFPNRQNPNTISTQNHRYRMVLNPQKLGKSQLKDGVIGVALNGIPFEPSTAECYGQKRGSRPNPHCEWREEAIVNGKGRLGLDQSNAHVQPNGTYHYHGIPLGFLSILPQDDLVHIGYAADGFRLIISRSEHYKPSYQLKSGTRPNGPGGRYDGTYTADFVYQAGSGDLDQCNGRDIGGEYVYFITAAFPFTPRCLMGQADSSFERRRGSLSPGTQGQRHHPPHHRMPPEHRRPPPHLR